MLKKSSMGPTQGTSIREQRVRLKPTPAVVGQYQVPPRTKKDQNYSTQYSQVVPHPSTNCANSSLTSEIRRDPVYSTVYGRSWTRTRGRITTVDGRSYWDQCGSIEVLQKVILGYVRYHTNVYPTAEAPFDWVTSFDWVTQRGPLGEP